MAYEPTVWVISTMWGDGYQDIGPDCPPIVVGPFITPMLADLWIDKHLNDVIPDGRIFTKAVPVKILSQFA